MDTTINWLDITKCNNAVESGGYTETQAEIMKYMSDGSLKPSNHNDAFDTWNVSAIIEYNLNI